MPIQIGRPRERAGWIYSIVIVNVSHIRTLSSVESTTSSPSIRLTVESIWNYAGNTLVNQHSDINKTHEILQDESKCEMIVVIENFMTSSAKYADILLPDLMTVEQEDIIPNDYAGNMGLNRPGFPGECFICELRLPDHRFRWKHNKLFLLLPEEYGPAFPAIVDCYTSPPTLVWPVPLLHGFSSSYGVLPPLCKDH